MLYCIGKLRKIPVTISHLEKTGVGRTVNSYRKWNDEVGNAAKELITIWREMVKNQAAKEEEEAEGIYFRNMHCCHHLYYKNIVKIFLFLTVYNKLWQNVGNESWLLNDEVCSSVKKSLIYLR